MLRRFALATMLLPTLFGAAARADDSSARSVIAINDRQFEIPVQIDADDPDVAEVRLYCSDDEGRTWRMHARSEPTASSFAFEAAEEREYWFFVKTVDRRGNETPQGRSDPELRVVVDTTPPNLQVECFAASGGAVSVSWKTDDLHVDAESFSLQCRASADAPWREMTPIRSKRQFDEISASGQIECRLPSMVAEPMLRAMVSDVAGNTTYKDVQVDVQRSVDSSLAMSNDAIPFESRSLNRNVGANLPSTSVGISRRDGGPSILVNSLSFELDYDVARVPESTIEKVELWGTRDGGATWVCLGLDEDRRSPCTVNVEREGEYGFAIVVDAVGGPTGRAPRNGEAPEIRVGVDLVAPQVRLTTAEPDPAGEPGAMRINWTASDAHLGPQAVSLAYASSPQGPWLPLAIGVPNDGGRVCKFDAQSPDSVFLRIEVRDEAGNLGAHSTTMPIPVEKRQVMVRLAGATQDDPKHAGPKWFHVLR